MYDKANFFAILPSAVRYDPKLTSRSVLLYAALTSLAQADGEAYASNEYLTSVIGASERTVHRLLSELIAQKYITVRYEYKACTKEISRRFIRISALPTLRDVGVKQALYAVIPSHILVLPDLSVQAKLLYAEISAATPTDGFCSKPATFFAELMHASPSTVRRWIKELQDADAVRVEMEYIGDSREIKRRRIYLTAAAEIAEKRAETAQIHAVDFEPNNCTNESDGAKIADRTEKRSMLIFDTTPESEIDLRPRPRKIVRKRKKATEKLRL